MVPDLIILALDYYRAPLRFAHLADADRPLPEGFHGLVSAFGSALSPRNIETTAKALGSRPEEIQRASSFFLRQVLLAPGGNHYRALGVSASASEETIRQHYQLLVRIIHPDRSLDDAERDALHTARINDAYNVLRNPVTRHEYDKQQASALGRKQAALSAQKSVPRGASLRPNTLFAKAEIGPSIHSRRDLMIIIWAGIALAAVVAFAIFLSSNQPMLRINPELADQSIAKPSFLRKSVSVQELDYQNENARPAEGAGVSPVHKATPAQKVATPDKVPGTAALLAEIKNTDSHEKARSRQQIRSAAMQEGHTSSMAYEQEGNANPATPVLVQVPPAERSAGKLQEPTVDQARRAVNSMRLNSKNIERVRSPRPGSEVDIGEHRKISTYPEESAEPEISTIESEPEQSKSVRPATSANINLLGPQVLNPQKGRGADTLGPKRPPEVATSVPSGPEPASTSPAKDSKIQPERSSRKVEEPAKKLTIQTQAADQADGAKGVPIRATPDMLTRSKVRPADVVARLRGFYQAGDLKNFVRLFTADARMKDGTGTDFIRADYARFFSATHERRLSINNLKWQSAGNGKMIGTGAYRAATKDNPRGNWRYLTGTLQIKLVPWADGYKISEMIHR